MQCRAVMDPALESAPESFFGSFSWKFKVIPTPIHYGRSGIPISESEITGIITALVQCCHMAITISRESGQIGENGERERERERERDTHTHTHDAACKNGVCHKQPLPPHRLFSCLHACPGPPSLCSSSCCGAAAIFLISRSRSRPGGVYDGSGCGACVQLIHMQRFPPLRLPRGQTRRPSRGCGHGLPRPQTGRWPRPACPT